MSGCILVVEDQMDNRQILRDLLGNAGYQLVEVGERRGGARRGRQAASGPDPDGHSAARHGRLNERPVMFPPGWARTRSTMTGSANT